MTEATLVRPLPDNLVLKHGKHASWDDGACVMEAVCYVAGERWTDSPACCCPAIAAFLRNWNDSLRTDEERTRLLAPLVPRLVGSKSTPEVELARAMLCVDWSIRVWLPAFLDLSPALTDNAAELLRDQADTELGMDLGRGGFRCSQFREKSVRREGCRVGCRGGCRGGCREGCRVGLPRGLPAWGLPRGLREVPRGDAARAAAWAAAWDAAWAAAWAAAGAAAWAAARAAARAAAGAAAWRDAIEPTVKTLQQSALNLVNRMLEVV